MPAAPNSVPGLAPHLAAPAPVDSETQASFPSDHHSVFCPNCSQRLTGHRCKLICSGCGYYLSCADYY